VFSGVNKSALYPLNKNSVSNDFEGDVTAVQPATGFCHVIRLADGSTNRRKICSRKSRLLCRTATLTEIGKFPIILPIEQW